MPLPKGKQREIGENMLDSFRINLYGGKVYEPIKRQSK